MNYYDFFVSEGIFVVIMLLHSSMYCSLNWQHQLCKNPRQSPDIKTLFVDHSCGQPNGARAPSPASNPLLGSMPKPGGFPALGAHGVSKLPSAGYRIYPSFGMFLLTYEILLFLYFDAVSLSNLIQSQFHLFPIGCQIQLQ